MFRLSGSVGALNETGTLMRPDLVRTKGADTWVELSTDTGCCFVPWAGLVILPLWTLAVPAAWCPKQD